MPTQRVGILPSEDRLSIIRGAQRLGLDPYEFGAFLSLESGMNMDPNIVGGAGGRHRGLIQFGPNEQRIYNISGKQTRAQQMPSVLQYFEDRGYKPGMGIARAYATVLGGNPNVSLNSQDSFGTSVNKALPRFRKGGDLYENARRVLGDIPSDSSQVSSRPATPAAPPKLAGQNASILSLMQQMLPTATTNVIPNLFSAGTSASPLQNLFNKFGPLQ